MYLKQFVRDESGCASYLIGSLRDGCAAVVDPQWAIEPYLQAAAAKGLRITQVLETHLHADHVSGARRVAEQTGAEIGIHAAAGVAFPHRALQETDGERATEPCAVLTGDTLFVGGVGRPDLGGAAREHATTLYESLFGKLLTLSDFVEVYPSHVGGSSCGAGLSGATSSTIGFERRYNYAAQPRSVDQFVDLVTGDLPPQPGNFETIGRKTRGLLPVAEPKGTPLSPAAVHNLLATGGEGGERAMVLDARSLEAFGAGHLPGAVNVPLRGPAFGV